MMATTEILMEPTEGTFDEDFWNSQRKWLGTVDPHVVCVSHPKLEAAEHTESPWCWWCRLPMCRQDDYYRVPVRYDRKSRRFLTDGMCCGARCAKAYFQTTQAGRNHPEMFAQLYGRDIPAAPHWQALCLYGGHLSVADFRALCDPQGNVTIRRNEKPSLTWTPEMITEIIDLRKRQSDIQEVESLLQTGKSEFAPRKKRDYTPRVPRNGAIQKHIEKQPLSATRRQFKLSRSLPVANQSSFLESFVKKSTTSPLV